MKFTGLLLDQHDDSDLAVLQGVFKGREVPSLIKSASLLDAPSLHGISNESFALCAIDNGQLTRKFAMVDPAVTALSAVYFLETKDQLPEAAQKVAAANLIEGCVLHGIEPPVPLVKVAAGALPQTFVDISGQLPPIKVAQPGEGIQLDTQEKTAVACAWFDENHPDMHPRERHATAVPLLKQAKAQGVKASETLERYGSQTYAPSLKTAHVTRLNHLGQDDTDGQDLLNLLFDKAASVSPERFAEGLAEFDKGMNLDQYWDKGIPNPWYATFGQIKTAEYVFTDGNDRVTGSALLRLAQNPLLLKESFSGELVDGFMKNPVVVFDSLPLAQKKIIMRIATDQNSGGVNTRTA